MLKSVAALAQRRTRTGCVPPTISRLSALAGVFYRRVVPGAFLPVWQMIKIDQRIDVRILAFTGEARNGDEASDYVAR